MSVDIGWFVGDKFLGVVFCQPVVYVPYAHVGDSIEDLQIDYPVFILN